MCTWVGVCVYVCRCVRAWVRACACIRLFLLLVFLLLLLLACRLLLLWLTRVEKHRRSGLSVALVARHNERRDISRSVKTSLNELRSPVNFISTLLHFNLKKESNKPII